jgi:hypothetical protein
MPLGRAICSAAAEICYPCKELLKPSPEVVKQLVWVLFYEGEWQKAYRR